MQPIAQTNFRRRTSLGQHLLFGQRNLNPIFGIAWGKICLLIKKSQVAEVVDLTLVSCSTISVLLLSVILLGKYCLKLLAVVFELPKLFVCDRGVIAAIETNSLPKRPRLDCLLMRFV